MRKNVSYRDLKLWHETDFVLVQPEEAPSGILVRGHYDALSKFVDDDGHSHLEFDWSFDITKEWK